MFRLIYNSGLQAVSWGLKTERDLMALNRQDNMASVARKSPPERRELSEKMMGKIPIREGGVSLEVFGGCGDALAAHLKGLKHVAIEKDEKHAALYKKRHPGTEVHHGKWEKILPDLPLGEMDLCMLDVDPYGEPFEALKVIAAKAAIKKPCMLFTTFGFLRYQFQGHNQQDAIKKLCTTIERSTAWKAERLMTLPAVRCVLAAHMLHPPITKAETPGFWSSIFR